MSEFGFSRSTEATGTRLRHHSLVDSGSCCLLAGGGDAFTVFTEATDVLHLHALIEIGLVLFIITLVVNALSRLLIWSMK